MRLIIISACAWLFEASAQKSMSMRTPSLILDLLFNESPKVNPFVKLVSLRTWVADPAFRVQVLSDLLHREQIDLVRQHRILHLHDPLAVHSKIHTAKLL